MAYFSNIPEATTIVKEVIKNIGKCIAQIIIVIY